MLSNHVVAMATFNKPTIRYNRACLTEYSKGQESSQVAAALLKEDTGKSFFFFIPSYSITETYLLRSVAALDKL